MRTTPNTKQDPKAARTGVSRPAPRFAFAKTDRLLKHASFKQVYETGQRQFSQNMTFFFVLSESETPSVRLGFTVSRALGGSVERNRMRRRVREAVRPQLAELKIALAARGLSADVVINPKKTSLKAGFETLRAEVAKGFAAIGSAKPKKAGA